MTNQSLGKYLRQEASKKGYSNTFVSQHLNIHVTTVSKHFNNKLKITDTDLMQYCKLFQLSFEVLKKNFAQVEYYICQKETHKKIVAGLLAVGASVLVYNFVKQNFDENCSNRYLTN